MKLKEVVVKLKVVSRNLWLPLRIVSVSSLARKFTVYAQVFWVHYVINIPRFARPYLDHANIRPLYARIRFEVGDVC